MYLIIAILTISLAASYAWLFYYFNKGWNRIGLFLPEEKIPLKNSFSIIIPARNEENNILDCLNDIAAQHYPADQYEIIVADDFSEDQTAEIVTAFILQHPAFQIRLVKMADEPASGENSFKKQSIEACILHSRYDWIITTDADCRMGEKWLATIDSFISANDPVMVSAPVLFHRERGFFQKYQSLEFTGLIAIGAASIAMGTPNLCNGANLAYRKDAFYEAGGFSGNETIASGDDEFLMHKIHRNRPGKVQFLKNRDAIVYTRPAASLGEFVNQRRRWVSKSRLYSNKRITLILSGAWLFHACLLFCLIMGMVYPAYTLAFIAGFGIKIIAEYLFLAPVLSFFGRKYLLNLFAPSAFLYIFYVLIIGIYGNFGRYEWKGRRVN